MYSLQKEIQCNRIVKNTTRAGNNCGKRSRDGFLENECESTDATRDGRRLLQFYRNLNERQGGPAERLVLAENQAQLALNAGISQGERGQRFRLQVFRNVRARDEPDSH